MDTDVRLYERRINQRTYTAWRLSVRFFFFSRQVVYRAGDLPSEVVLLKKKTFTRVYIYLDRTPIVPVFILKSPMNHERNARVSNITARKHKKAILCNIRCVRIINIFFFKYVGCFYEFPRIIIKRKNQRVCTVFSTR